MESRPALLHTPGNNACWETESNPSGQHRKGNISPETKTKLEEKQCNEAKEEKCTGHVKTLKHTALASNADLHPASKIPTMHSTTTKQITNANKTASKQPAKSSTSGVEVLSSTSGAKLKSPNANHEKKLQAKLFPKNIQKAPSTSHIMGSTEYPQKMLQKTASASQISSTDSPKSLNRLSLSHIPKASSSPKIKASSPTSLKVDKAERIKKMASKETASPKDKTIDAESKPGAKTALRESLLGQPEIKSGDISSLVLHRESNPEQPKSPEDKADEYVTTQERKIGKSLWEQKEPESKECTVKNDNIVNNTAYKSSTSKNQKDSATMTLFSSIAMKDAAIQTDVISIDAEIQAVVKLCSKATEMSPVRNTQTIRLDSDNNPEVNLRNDLNPDSNSDSDWLSNGGLMDSTPIGAKPRFLGPPPYKSPNTQKPHQHVCQIEIELCSESPQTFGLNPPDVTISDATYQAEKTSIKCLGKTGEVDGQKDKSAAPQQIVWDEQGMTWEVYGAALDMESLGFAIQSHLQCKIREHERRIGTLRKSICLSEQSPGKGRTVKRKRNVFRSLFAGSHCCSKQRPDEGIAK
ncbi:G protein-regulated inducer of neurite outgrowth 3 [Danio aesculapii]|uniref:G protein-regulated inducer of neurite outgrowth 3 n=1 Tax=Danio aesculapii TaxID=1142201 RepID=UPI0024C03F18|nr:G protein-regulated inducer of neurite outgrowth 3 [Danio aesculapii]